MCHIRSVRLRAQLCQSIVADVLRSTCPWAVRIELKTTSGRLIPACEFANPSKSATTEVCIDPFRFGKSFGASGWCISSPALEGLCARRRSLFAFSQQVKCHTFLLLQLSSALC